MNKLSARVSPCSAPTATTLQVASPSDCVSPKMDPGTASVSENSGDQNEGGINRGKVSFNFSPLRAALRITTGSMLAVCMAASWVWGAHSAKEALTRLNAPFFIIWFCSIWNLLFFPLYYLGCFLGTRQRQWPSVQFGKYGRLLGDGHLTVRLLLKGASPFSLLWTISGYLYLLALCRISISDISAMLCCSQAFDFLLSWIGLKDRFMGVRIVGAILSITGIVMMAYADGFRSDSITGVALGVGSASTSAFYKILFRRRVGETQPGPASVVLSCVGLCSLVLHSWLCVLLYLTHVEYWPASQPIPWDTLCITASLLLAFSLLVHMGEVATYSTLISVGILLTIPASAAAETLMSSAPEVSHMHGAAGGIIAAGYIMLLLPENWDEWIGHWYNSLWHAREENVLGEEYEMDTPLPTRPKYKSADTVVL